MASHWSAQRKSPAAFADAAGLDSIEASGRIVFRPNGAQANQVAELR
jgi:hypothetical protein